MADKFLGTALYIIGIVFALIILYWVIQPLFSVSIGFQWMHFYVRVFLILFVVNTFAQLRLYNAIVQNTRFAIKLREVIGKLMQSTPTLERTIRTLTSAMSSEKTVSDNLKKSLDRNVEATEELTKRVENIKFNSKIEKK